MIGAGWRRSIARSATRHATRLSTWWNPDRLSATRGRRLAAGVASGHLWRGSRLHDGLLPRDVSLVPRLQRAGTPSVADSPDVPRPRPAASNIAHVVCHLQAQGVVVGDLDDSNLLLGPGGDIALLAAASFELEARPRSRDDWALAVLLFRLLMEGEDTLSVDPIGPALSANLTPELRDAFTRTFEEGHDLPERSDRQGVACAARLVLSSPARRLSEQSRTLLSRRVLPVVRPELARIRGTRTRARPARRRREEEETSVSAPDPLRSNGHRRPGGRRDAWRLGMWPGGRTRILSLYPRAMLCRPAPFDRESGTPLSSESPRDTPSPLYRKSRAGPR